MSNISRYRSIRETQPYIYADIQLEFETQHINHDINVREFKLILMSSLQSLFGDFGCSIPIDVIKYRQSDCRAFIRTNSKDLVLVRNALIMLHKWKENICCFHIFKICHSLSSLTIESLNQTHLIIE